MRIPVNVGGDSGTNVGRHSGSSWAVSRRLMLAADYLLLRGIRRQGFFPFAHRFTFEFEPMGSAQEAIQQGVSDGWVIAQVRMPMSDRQLAGQERRTPAVASRI